MKTYIPKQSDFDQKTYIVDAKGKTLGRLATKVASTLIGKHKPVFCQDQVAGDRVIVINAAQVYVSGNKREQKIYTHYTGHPSGLRTYNFDALITKKPEEVIMRAVSRMLPKKHLGSKMLKRLRVFAGAEHNQQSLQPVTLEV